MPISQIRKILIALCGTALIAGCTAGPAPSNLTTSVYAPGQVAWNGSNHPQGDWITQAPVARGAPTCDWRVPRELDTYTRVAPASFLDRTAPLASGDRLEITVLGDPDRLTGTYVIDSDGSLAIRGMPPVDAAGTSIAQLTQRLRTQLIGAGLVRPLRNAVRVALIESSGAAVAVGGAVFFPGAVRAGDRTAESRIGLREGPVSGDDNSSRTLAGAIRAAGGVRPDADIQRIYLIRDRQYAEFDLSGFIHGWASQGVAVSSGDLSASSIQPPIVCISATPMPRVVKAGVPTRIPDGSIGLRSSNGIMFLFTVIPHRSSVSSACLPPMPSGVTSTQSKWLSVPPLTSFKPPAWRASASDFALSMTCWA